MTRQLRALPRLMVAAVLLLGLAQPAAAAAPAAPSGDWTFKGGGWGHGVGMSQYGAYGMALRGRSAGQILGFYFGGATVAGARLPASIRVGLLQDRADGIALRVGTVPGARPGGRLRVTAVHAVSGASITRTFAQGAELRAVVEGGGLSLRAGGRRVLGPARPGTALRLDYQHSDGAPVLLTLVQAGKTLRWGRLEIGAAGAGRATRLRAVAVLSWKAYVRGIAEMPRLWPLQAQRAQAIAARSYALAVVRAAGQHRDREDAGGCDCAVVADTRDQHYLGWAQERGPGAARWLAAADGTAGKVVAWRDGAVVKAYYSSSSGGHTATNRAFAGIKTALPWYPARRDPDDRAGGRNPNHSWTARRSAASVSAALAGLGLGPVTELRPVTREASGRLRTVLVRGTRGSRLLDGPALARRLGLKSSLVRAIGPPPPARAPTAATVKPPATVPPPATTAPARTTVPVTTSPSPERSPVPGS